MQKLLPTFLLFLTFSLLCASAPAGDFTYENDLLLIRGQNCEKGVLGNGELAYSNRVYVWQNVPKELQGVYFTKFGGGVAGTVEVTAKADVTVFAVLASGNHFELPLPWVLRSENAYYYTDGGKTSMKAYSRGLKKGETISIPQNGWTGTQLLFADSPIQWNPPKPLDPDALQQSGPDR